MSRKQRHSATASTKPLGQPDLDCHIRQIVDSAPPPSPSQRDRLAVLLRRWTRSNRVGQPPPGRSGLG